MSSGCTQDLVDLVQQAGVDVTKPEYNEQAMEQFRLLMDAYEDLSSNSSFQKDVIDTAA